MKKIFLFSIFLILFSCKKEEKKSVANGQIIFYSAHSNQEWGLIWEGTEIGKLKYAAQSPPCGSVGHITVDKAPGTYTIDFKSYSGFSWGNPKKVTVESGKCKFYPY